MRAGSWPIIIVTCLGASGCSTTAPAEDPDAGDTDTESGPDDSLDSFFGLDIHDITVTIDPDSVDDLVSAPREYTHASVTIDDTSFEDVGLRLKGGAGSFIPWGGDYPEISGDGNGNPGKNALIIDFNRWVGGTEFLGLKKLTVNNLVQDPSCVHEFLGYSLFLAGEIPASRSGWAMVTINEEVKGIYALVETPDNDEFLERHFGSSDGNLYEGEYGTDFTEDSIENFDQDSGDDESRADLAEVAAALDEIGEDEDPLATLEQYFDMTDYLTFAATEIYLGHWDGYVNGANNYAVYHDPTDDRWTFIPWGLDQLFVHEADFGGIMTGPGPSWQNGGRVHRLCFRSQECRFMLAEAFEDLLSNIDAIEYGGLAQEARELVEAQALLEATAHGDPDLTVQSLDQVIERIESRRAEIETWLPCLVGDAVDGDGDTYDGCDEDCDDDNPDRHPGATELCNFVDDDCNGVIDDPAGCPKCLDETGPGDVELSYCFELLGWQEAEQYCVDRGQHLASVHSDEEQEAATWPMLDLFGAWESWIGLSDAATEGEFAWIDGSDLDFEHWGSEAPGMGGPENDCVINTPDGWRDVACDEPRPFVCRTP